MDHNNNNNRHIGEGIKNLGNRIGEIAILVGGKKKLAQMTSISESQLYRYISGQSQPTAQPLAAIAEVGNVDLDWLITGKGNLLIRLPQKAGSVRQSVLSSPERLIEIPYYQLSEDDPNPNTQKMGKFAFRNDWLQENQLNIESLKLLHAYGDSMDTTIRNGDLLMIDTRQTELIGDAIFALRLDDHLIIKRVQHAVDGGIYLTSDNPYYREQHVPVEQINKLKIVGRVVWTAGKV